MIDVYVFHTCWHVILMQSSIVEHVSSAVFSVPVSYCAQ